MSLVFFSPKEIGGCSEEIRMILKEQCNAMQHHPTTQQDTIQHNTAQSQPPQMLSLFACLFLMILNQQTRAKLSFIFQSNYTFH